MVELTKEQFVEIINHIEEQLDKDDKLSDLMVCEDTTGWIVTAPHLITDVITLLTMMLDDQDEWISWWLWEVADDKSNAHVYIDGMKYCSKKSPNKINKFISNYFCDGKLISNSTTGLFLIKNAKNRIIKLFKRKRSNKQQ